MADKLSKFASVNRQFLRSVRLDADFGRPDALQGYILQPSARAALDTMARHIDGSQQRAFTWTGPYGGGKSSLALALVSLAGGDVKLRRTAKETLAVTAGDPISKCFGGSKPWAIVTVVGKRMSVIEAIGTELDRTIKKGVRGQRPQIAGRRDVVSELVKAVESDGEHGGILLVIDELGKFLEHAAHAGEDIGFYQELSEAASRCKGRLVVVGILHQAFEQYAARLGKDVQQEWAKVQGRFVDIPLVAATDEVISLIGRALQVSFAHQASMKVADQVAKVIRTRRPSAAGNIGQLLDACWPLHPVTAAMLGPASKKRFGQNERSVFSFLASAEPLAFSEALKGLDAAVGSYYWPAQFWDYLRTNFEPAILASPDSHRWAVCAEAIERTEARFSPLHQFLVKAVSLIELLRNGSGLAAERDLLKVCVPLADASKVETALNELTSASILIFRRHLGAYGVYAGSDFDIELAIRDAKSRAGIYDHTKLSQLVDLGPVTARRHYWETGAMRWFSRSIVNMDLLDSYVSAFRPGGSQCGELVLALIDRATAPAAATKLAKRVTADAAARGVLIGIPSNASRIEELIGDLAALEFVKANSRELHGDSVAQTEVSSRLRAARVELVEELRETFQGATWHYEGHVSRQSTIQGLSHVASDVADSLYPDAPHAHSELINRNTLSSAAVKALRDLLHAMLTKVGEMNLGYSSFSADAGLYYSVVRNLGLHREIKGVWRFADPLDDERGKHLIRAWRAAANLVLQGDKATKLSELYDTWRAAPFGVKEGLLPILALAFFQRHRHQLALFIQGSFTPDVTEAHIDEWLQDPKRIEWRFVRIDASERKMLTALSTALSTRLGYAVAADALDSARALVALVYRLPAWTRRTDTVSVRAKDVRRLLINASDPHKVLFADLPLILSLREPQALANGVADVVGELSDAFGARLRLIEQRLLQALDHSGDLAHLRLRGGAVAGLGADFKLDAFATRIGTYSGQLSDLEGLIMLAVSKPTKDWTDHDMNAGEVQLLSWAFELRRLESLAAVRDRPATRRAIGVVFGAERTVTGTFDVSESDTQHVEQLAKELVSKLGRGIKQEVLLAAIARAGAAVFEKLERERSHGHG
jgi:hypothetical protein